MKHLGKVSVARRARITDKQRDSQDPGFADAKTDWINAMYRDFNNFVYAKKNETRL
jgi:hypothetical protein